MWTLDKLPEELHNNKKLRHFIILYIQQRLHVLNISKERKIVEEGSLLSNSFRGTTSVSSSLRIILFCLFHKLIRSVLIESIFF